MSKDNFQTFTLTAKGLFDKEYQIGYTTETKDEIDENGNRVFSFTVTPEHLLTDEQRQKLGLPDRTV